MNVLPIDVIARSDGFEAAALGRELRPWEWTFIHAVDGRMQLRDVADLCGLELALAAEIVSEQTESGILRVVTMTLDDYRRWSGVAADAAEASRDVAPPPLTAAVEQPGTGRALHDEMLAELLNESTTAVAEPAAASPDPFAGEHLEPEPVEPATLGPAALASDLFARDLFTPEPLSVQTAAPEQTVPDHVAPDAFAPDAFAPDAFAPDPFAPDPFAHEPFAAESLAHESFAHELDALEANAPAPLGSVETGSPAKGVALSFDSFDTLDALDGFGSAPETPAPAAPEGITLSFEPGDHIPELPSAPPSAGGGVSLSFEPDSSPLAAIEPPRPEPSAPIVPTFFPSAAIAPVTEAPAAAHVSPTDPDAPINLAFSPDGFPILTPAASSEAPPVAVVPAADPPPQARTSSAAGDDHSDIVGSLIARVLSIRIK